MFCEKCGSQIPEGSNVCPNCAAVNAPTPAPAPAPAPQQVTYVQQPAAANGGNALGTIGLICGVLSLVVAVLGGIMFGVIAASIAAVLGVVGLIIGVNTKKQTGGAKGTGAFVCGLLGLIFGIIFAVGCAACGSCSVGYGCHGCVGSSCAARNDLNKAANSLEDMFKSMDWDY